MLKPTEAELEILQLLWKEGSSSVRQINDSIQSKREIGYTTTLKTMQIMHQKGLVKRKEKGRGHLYTAVVSELKTKKSLLKEFIQATFQGSTSKLVMQALGGSKTTKEELDEIKELITKLENK